MSDKVYIYIIGLACLVALISNFGSNISIIEPLFFTGFEISNASIIFSQVSDKNLFIEEWWRLITPIFIHFSLTHLVFNCLWMYILGQKIEVIDGKSIFILICLFSAIFGNLMHFYFSGVSIFGGLSGVVYGLLGFCFSQELMESRNKYLLPPALYLFMLIWLCLGFTGLLDLLGFGKIANFAHLGGLIGGFTMSYIFKLYNDSKSYESS